MILHLGNNKEALKTFENNSIDSIVTDPPYELGFMGKSWDSSGIAYDVELWSELLRVLKPGGHLLAFSGTRTYHRMAVAIEDAGFEIRDMIEWVYGSGFPKSLNIGKAVDKLQGNEREVIEWVEQPFKIDNGAGDAEYCQLKGTKTHNEKGYRLTPITKPVSKEAEQFEGWGTALKPAHEPICMARKPIQGTVAQNCLKWGTGGINIDESRVGTEGAKQKIVDKNNPQSMNSMGGGQFYNGKIIDADFGRFPANLIHDGSEEVMACFPETKGEKRTQIINKGTFSTFNSNKTPVNTPSYNDNGGNASRFFKSIIYNSKPSKAERNKGCEPVFNLFEQSEGLPLGEAPASARSTPADGRENALGNQRANFHPTVKPVELMEYLIKMVTPKGGVVLDPFMGSGTTGCGAVKNGFEFIGIDLTPEYLEIAEKRIKRYMQL